MRSRIAMLLSALCLASCTPIGPEAISTTRNSFNEVINETSTQQLLLNLVRAKNAEITTFVDVAETDSTNAASIGVSGGPSNIGAGALGAITGTAGASDSELYRLIPVQGFALIQQVATPIPPDAIVKLNNSDFSLLPTLHFAVDRLTPGYTDYVRAQDLLTLLNNRGALVLSAEGNSAVAKDEKALLGNKQATSDQNLIFSLRGQALLTPQSRGLREMRDCRLDTENTQAVVKKLWANLTSLYGVNSNQIVLTGSSNSRRPFFFSTRSALGTLKLGENNDPDFDFETSEDAALIRDANKRAPCHLDDYYYRPATIDGNLQRYVDEMWAGLYADAVSPTSEPVRASTRRRGSQRVFIIIETSAQRPPNAYVTVFRKGVWYSIDDTDVISKLNFQLLNQIVTIQSIPVQSVPLTPSIPLK